METALSQWPLGSLSEFASFAASVAAGCLGKGTQKEEWAAFDFTELNKTITTRDDEAGRTRTKAESDVNIITSARMTTATDLLVDLITEADKEAVQAFGESQSKNLNFLNEDLLNVSEFAKLLKIEQVNGGRPVDDDEQGSATTGTDELPKLADEADTGSLPESSKTDRKVARESRKAEKSKMALIKTLDDVEEVKRRIDALNNRPANLIVRENGLDETIAESVAAMCWRSWSRGSELAMLDLKVEYFYIQWETMRRAALDDNMQREMLLESAKKACPWDLEELRRNIKQARVGLVKARNAPLILHVSSALLKYFEGRGLVKVPYGWEYGHPSLVDSSRMTLRVMTLSYDVLSPEELIFKKTMIDRHMEWAPDKKRAKWNVMPPAVDDIAEYLWRENFGAFLQQFQKFVERAMARTRILTNSLDDDQATSSLSLSTGGGKSSACGRSRSSQKRG